MIFERPMSINEIMTADDQKNNIREKCSSLLAPHFEILFSAVDKLSTRYGITLPLEFWLALTFSIYAATIHIFGYSDMELMFFFSLVFLSAIYANFGLIFNYYKKIRDLPPESTRFLNMLDNKETGEVQKFLRDFRRLKSEEILIILRSRFCSIPAIHMSIASYQSISGEILDYIANNCLNQNLDPDIIKRYIFAVKDDVSNETIDKILIKYNIPAVKKSLLVCFPSHFEKIFVLSTLAKIRIAIRDWFRYGSGNAFVGLPAIIITIWVWIIDFPLFWNTVPKSDIFSQAFGVLNLLMAFFVLFGLLFIIFKFVFIILPLRISKHLLYYLVPSSRLHYLIY